MANIFRVERAANKITLGTTGTTINIASHTASRLLALDANKDLTVKAIGTDVQAFGAVLDDLNTLGANAADSEFLVGTGAGALAWENAATARTSLGVGTGDSPAFVGVNLGTGELTCGVIDRAAGTLTLGIGGTPEISITSASSTFGGNLVILDGGTIGQAAGPLLAFDDTNNYLEITGCKVGIGSTTPSELLTLSLGINVGDIGDVIAWGNEYMGGEPQGRLGFTGSDPWRIYIGYGSNQPEHLVIDVSGKVGIGDTSPGELLDVAGNTNVTGVYKVDDIQIISNRVIDARCDDTINSGDATTDGVIDALRDAMITHGLIAAA